MAPSATVDILTAPDGRRYYSYLDNTGCRWYAPTRQSRWERCPAAWLEGDAGLHNVHANVKIERLQRMVSSSRGGGENNNDDDGDGENASRDDGGKAEAGGNGGGDVRGGEERTVWKFVPRDTGEAAETGASTPTPRECYVCLDPKTRERYYSFGHGDKWKPFPAAWLPPKGDGDDEDDDDDDDRYGEQVRWDPDLFVEVDEHGAPKKTDIAGDQDQGGDETAAENVEGTEKSGGEEEEEEGHGEDNNGDGGDGVADTARDDEETANDAAAVEYQLLVRPDGELLLVSGEHYRRPGGTEWMDLPAEWRTEEGVQLFPYTEEAELQETGERERDGVTVYSGGANQGGITKWFAHTRFDGRKFVSVDKVTWVPMPADWPQDESHFAAGGRDAGSADAGGKWAWWATAPPLDDDDVEDAGGGGGDGGDQVDDEGEDKDGKGDGGEGDNGEGENGEGEEKKDPSADPPAGPRPPRLVYVAPFVWDDRNKRWEPLVAKSCTLRDLTPLHPEVAPDTLTAPSVLLVNSDGGTGGANDTGSGDTNAAGNGNGNSGEENEALRLRNVYLVSEVDRKDAELRELRRWNAAVRRRLERVYGRRMEQVTKVPSPKSEGKPFRLHGISDAADGQQGRSNNNRDHQRHHGIGGNQHNNQHQPRPPVSEVGGGAGGPAASKKKSSNSLYRGPNSGGGANNANNANNAPSPVPAAAPRTGTTPTNNNNSNNANKGKKQAVEYAVSPRDADRRGPAIVTLFDVQRRVAEEKRDGEIDPDATDGMSISESDEEQIDRSKGGKGGNDDDDGDNDGDGDGDRAGSKKNRKTRRSSSVNGTSAGGDDATGENTTGENTAGDNTTGDDTTGEKAEVERPASAPVENAVKKVRQPPSREVPVKHVRPPVQREVWDYLAAPDAAKLR